MTDGSQTGNGAGARRILEVFPEKSGLANDVATRFLSCLNDTASGTSGAVHVALTGGTMGIAVLAAVSHHPDRDRIDWSRVHFWWGDERWLPRADNERNEKQARDELLDHLPLPAENIHAFPSSDAGVTLEDASLEYSRELAHYAEPGNLTPVFDVTFLGMGPDGHIASLFPHRPEVDEVSRPVVAVRKSPKPPPERLSLSLPVLNASRRVWIVVAGSEKASALTHALEPGTDPHDIPAAGIATHIVTFFADTAAAPHSA